jgi:hypothetical protein
MINLEDTQAVAKRIAIRIRVEAGSEHHRLPDTTLNRSRQSILGEAGSYGDEEPHPLARGVLFCIAGDGFGVPAGDAQRQRIGKNPAFLQNLMSGAVNGGGPRGPAWLSSLHE